MKPVDIRVKKFPHMSEHANMWISESIFNTLPSIILAHLVYVEDIQGLYYGQ